MDKLKPTFVQIQQIDEPLDLSIKSNESIRFGETHFNSNTTPPKKNQNPTLWRTFSTNPSPPINSEIKKTTSTRPFKALSFNSSVTTLIPQVNSSLILTEVAKLGAHETMALIKDSEEKYIKFKERMLGELVTTSTKTNENMRRIQNNANQPKDFEYLEKRRKNNESAKRSRDARKIKQDELAIRKCFLEQENIILNCKIRAELEALERLKSMSICSKKC